jgi:hypothetical protein
MVNKGIYSILRTPLNNNWTQYYAQDFSLKNTGSTLAQNATNSTSTSGGCASGEIGYYDTNGNWVCEDIDPGSTDESWWESKIRKKLNEKLEEVGILNFGSNSQTGQEDWYENFSSQDISGYTYLNNMGINRWWEVSRNICYVFFVIIFIIVGFLIMFRKRLDSDIVITLGNALPNLILGVILVTFSFAIVGIILDTGRLALGVTTDYMRVELFEPEGIEDRSTGLEGAQDYYDDILSGYEVDFIGKEALEKIPLIGKALADSYDTTAATALHLSVLPQFLRVANKIGSVVVEGNPDVSGATFGITDVVFELINALIVVAGGALKAATTVPLIILLLVQGFALLVSVKLYLTIFMTYLKIFIETIFAPFYITMGSLPGKGKVTMDWVKRLASAVLTFTAIVVILNFANYLAYSSMVDLPNLNFFGEGGLTLPKFVPLPFIIVLGGYFLASNAGKYLDAFFKIEDGGLVGGVKDSISKIPLIGGAFK